MSCFEDVSNVLEGLARVPTSDWTSQLRQILDGKVNDALVRFVKVSDDSVEVSKEEISDALGCLLEIYGVESQDVKEAEEAGSGKGPESLNMAISQKTSQSKVFCIENKNKFRNFNR